MMHSGPTSKHVPRIKFKNITSTGDSAKKRYRFDDGEVHTRNQGVQDEDLSHEVNIQRKKRGLVAQMSQIHHHAKLQAVRPLALSLDHAPSVLASPALRAQVGATASHQASFLFSTQREDEQQERVERLLDNLKLIKGRTKDQLGSIVEQHTDLR
jgi:hypothetical protein